MTVIIEPHNPAWIEYFKVAQKELQSILADVPIKSIEHIGSTAVPGLIAKPVIDIAIIVAEENVDAASDALVKAGYTALGILGVPSRWAFRQPGYTRWDQAAGSKVEGGGWRRNTYVTIDGCASLRNHMDLKRTLIADEELRNEYGAVKTVLVENGLDVDEYCWRKSDIIFKILGAAGWSEDDLEVVREANRLNKSENGI